jgi:hypothetical protein
VREVDEEVKVDAGEEDKNSDTDADASSSDDGNQVPPKVLSNQCASDILG